MSSLGESHEARPGTQAVERAIAIMHCFREDATPLGVSEIARTVGLNISTAHRLMRALVAAGFLEQDPTTERYRLGIEIAVLGQRALEQAGYHLAKPVLARLADATGESVSLGVRRNLEVVVLERVSSPQPLRFDHPSGAELHMHASGMGKVMLAFGEIAPEAAVAQLKELPRFTEHTVGDLDVLVRMLLEARSRGYATNLEERYLGVNGVAAPVLATNGIARAAVGVQGPSMRLTRERIDEIAPLVPRRRRRDRRPRAAPVAPRRESFEGDTDLPQDVAYRCGTVGRFGARYVPNGSDDAVERERAVSLEQRPRHRRAPVDTDVDALERRHAEQHRAFTGVHRWGVAHLHLELPTQARPGGGAEHHAGGVVERSGRGGVQVAVLVEGELHHAVLHREQVAAALVAVRHEHTVARR